MAVGIHRDQDDLGFRHLHLLAPPRAVAELKQANQQDPRVLYHLGLGYQGQGDAAKAKETLAAAANFNALSFNYAYVRKKAQQALAKG